MLNYVIYSHTDYSRILEIQTDYIQKYEGTKTLLVNHEPELDLTDIYDKYDRVIFYKDNVPYSDRLLEGLSQLNMDYVLVMHENDILLQVDNATVSYLNTLMIQENIDRIEMKHTPSDAPDHNSIILDDTMYLMRQLTPSFYIFNVNPSIWKRTSYIEMLSNFPHREFRQIENLDIQCFCLRYKVYKPHTRKFFRCGFYDSTPFFKYVHITHTGKLLLPAKTEETCKTEYGQSYIDVNEELKIIVAKYFPEIPF